MSEIWYMSLETGELFDTHAMAMAHYREGWDITVMEFAADHWVERNTWKHR